MGSGSELQSELVDAGVLGFELLPSATDVLSRACAGARRGVARTVAIQFGYG